MKTIICPLCGTKTEFDTNDDIIICEQCGEMLDLNYHENSYEVYPSNINSQEIKDAIIYYSQKYYEGNPEISDSEFDSLIEQLGKLSPNDPLLKTTSYGYQTVKEKGKKIQHKYRPVGSLNKVNLSNWKKHFQGDESYCISSKHDGGSLMAYYNESNNLEMVLTRGDGKIGIDVTDKIKHIIPNHVSLPNVAVRGEITMKKTVFEQYYPDAASSRNMALGIINRDDPSMEEIKRLSFIAYNIYGEKTCHTKEFMMSWLSQNGFEVAEHIWVNLKQTGEDYLESLKGKLDNLYLADGLVITRNFPPDDEIAYKFIAETAETTVTHVEWEISRLGYLIPIVHFNPVKLSGATLSKCSGFNAKWILDHLICQGAAIIVHRSGEVIPYIKEIKPVTTWNNQNWLNLRPPENCPSCNEDLEWKGVHLQCVNEECPGVTKFRFLLWYETLARIDNLSESILEPFCFVMGWKEISDIYNDTYDHWKKVIESGWDTPHARKLLWQLYDKIREPVDPDLFIASFGLPAVGQNTSKRISDEIGLEKYFSGKPSGSKTLDLPSKTPKVEDIIIWLQNLSRITSPAIDSLLQHFDKMRKVYQQIILGPGFIQKANGQKIKVVITGKLSKPRKELAEEFARYGVEVSETLNSETRYLITDDPNSNSSKNQKARKLGTTVISEIDFRKENIR